MEHTETTRGDGETGYRVDDLIIDVGRQRVTRGETEIPLPQLSFELLLALARAAPNVLTFDQLIERVWQGLVVSPETVSQRVKLVRDALGDDPHSPRYIAGVRGRGYRMLAPVTPMSEPTASLPAPAAETGTRVDVVPSSVHKRWQWPIVAAAAAGALVVAGVALLIVMRAPDREDSSIAISPVRTIAVLPFVNLSGNSKYEYISDGLTEELLNRLTSISNLQVAARTSSFYFKGKNETVQTIGKMLGVGHLLEGSVRQQGDQIRVTAQLVSAANGYRLWSQTFERQIADIFTLQDEIARAVADNLQLSMVSDARSSLASYDTARPTTNTDAYLSYLRAKNLAWADQLKLAVKEFQQAVSIDPNYAGAYVGIASTYLTLGEIQAITREEALEPARVAIARALELDPDLAQAWAVKGRLLAAEWEPAAKVIPVLEHAVALNPSDTEALTQLAWVYDDQGRHQDARHLWERVYKLDPMVPRSIAALALINHNLGDGQAAAELIAELERSHPAWAGEVRANIAFRQGRFDDYARWWGRMAKAEPDSGWNYLWLTEAHLYLGDIEGASRYLEAMERRDPNHVRALFRRIDILVARGDAAGARAALNVWTAKNPKFPATFAHGHLSYWTRDCPHAVSSYLSEMPLLSHPEPEFPSLGLYRLTASVPPLVWCLREIGETARANTLSRAFGTYLRRVETPGEKAYLTWLRVRLAAASGERASVVKQLSILWATGGMLPTSIPREPLFEPYVRDAEVKAQLVKFDERLAERRAKLAAEGV
jgi:TolB-like protein/DNA-binding winged helix-turn-helix (wHTH) protein/Tfp pilus assembly protein PilF